MLLHEPVVCFIHLIIQTSEQRNNNNNNRKCRISLFRCLFTIPHQTNTKNVVSSFWIVASNVIHSFIHPQKYYNENCTAIFYCEYNSRKNETRDKDIYMKKIDTKKSKKKNQAAFPVNCMAIQFFFLFVYIISYFSSFIRISIMIYVFIWCVFFSSSNWVYLADETMTMHCRFHGDDLNVNTWIVNERKKERQKKNTQMRW